MALAGLALAGLAWVAGWPAGALGILLGTPIGLINHALTMPLARGRAEDRLTKSLAWRLPLRLVLAAAGLGVGYRISLDTMIGVAVGATLEVLFYTLTAILTLLRSVGGRSRSRHD